MRKILFILVAVMSLSAQAQTTGGSAAAGHTVPPATMRFGYLSYDSVLHAMPEYAAAMEQLTTLRAKYDAEAKRGEEEFNSKYEAFLEGQRDFPPTILQKRQSELQEMMERNIAFRDESRRLLKSAERDILAPLHARLAAILKTVGEERGYSFIINTDNNACPFINTAQGEDIEPLVRARF